MIPPVAGMPPVGVPEGGRIASMVLALAATTILTLFISELRPCLTCTLPPGVHWLGLTLDYSTEGSGHSIMAPVTARRVA